MAAEDLAVGGDGLCGAVGVEDEFPAEAVDADLVVILAQQDEVLQAGLAALGAAGLTREFRGSGGDKIPPGYPSVLCSSLYFAAGQRGRA
jgi:hypothetical protein